MGTSGNDQTVRRLAVALFDAFTERRFAGNVAGVVTEATGLDTELMARIAGELEAPTTGFVRKLDRDRRELRFFTPTQEIDMCGHVVVGVTTALAEEREIVPDASGAGSMHYETRAGPVAVQVTFRNGRPERVLMRQRKPEFREAAVRADEVAELLGTAPGELEPGLPIEIVSTGLRHLVVPFRRLEGVRRLQPDFPGLARMSRVLGVDTVPVFSRETVDPDAGLHVRDFSAGIGKPEEPGSGTTNGALGCYLVRHGAMEVSETRPAVIEAEQGLELGRPCRIRSEIHVRAGLIERVEVGGTAVRTLSGHLFLDDARARRGASA